MTEDEARRILGEEDIICPDNSLFSLGAYISWAPGDKLVIDNDPLALELTPTFLKALAWWMENH